jgi:hypothetical protein
LVVDDMSEPLRLAAVEPTFSETLLGFSEVESRFAGELLNRNVQRTSQRDLRRSWMQHDALWFHRVAERFGADEANRLNVTNLREIGFAEMLRFRRSCGVRRPVDEAMAIDLLSRLAQLAIGDLVDYDFTFEYPNVAFWTTRCFAFEGVNRVGIAKAYECGPLPRVVGWLEALGFSVQSPPEKGCHVAHGRACRWELIISNDNNERRTRRTTQPPQRPKSLCASVADFGIRFVPSPASGVFRASMAVVTGSLVKAGDVLGQLAQQGGETIDVVSPFGGIVGAVVAINNERIHRHQLIAWLDSIPTSMDVTT